ncbi:MAG: peptidylprolyl isomerase [Leptospiraceae bacterium]|nr:peptidylprolyl isomerase [Leptospiraceae bacterium]
MRKYILLALLTIGSVSCQTKKRDVIKELEEPMQSQDNPLILMRTNLGNMYIELYPNVAPRTVENFLGLALGKKEFTDTDGKKAKRPFYEGLSFHRVIPNFMIQGGDPRGDGTGGPGYQFEDEISAKALGLDKIKLKDAPSYQREAQLVARQRVFEKLNIRSQEDLQKKMKEANALFQKEIKQLEELSVQQLLELAGYRFDDRLPSVPVSQYTIAMANAGPNTNGSQFFINIVDNHYLNGKHTVFGKLLKGRDVLQKIAAIERDENDKPKQKVVIEKIILLE